MKISASRIELGESCLWWARSDVSIPEHKAGRAAEVGTAAHEVFDSESDIDEASVDERWRRAVLGEAEEEAGQDLTDKERGVLASLVASWRKSDLLRGVPWHMQEVAFAINPTRRTARMIPKGEQRDYSDVGPDEIPGTADVIGMTADGTIFVLDYKTGSRRHKFRDHERQLVFLATAVALVVGAHEVRAIAAHVKEDEVTCDGHDVDSLDMGVMVAHLQDIQTKITDAEASPGLHCDDLYCPAKAVCPVTRALLATATVPLDSRTRLSIVGEIKSNEDALATLIAIPLVEAWIAQRKRDAKAFADRSPVVAPDGRTYGPRDQRKEIPVLEVRGAEEAIRGVLGVAADSAIKTERYTSWKLIGDAIRARRAAGEKIVIKDTEEHTRAALRSVGALKVSTYQKYEWRKAKEACGTEP